MTFEDACKIVALKHKLGKKLVTGHMVKYFEEAALIYSEYQKEKLLNNMNNHTNLLKEIENRYQLIREEIMDDDDGLSEDDLNREADEIYEERFGIDYNDDLEKVFTQFLIDEGYFELKYIDNVGWCGLYRFAFTIGLVMGMNEYGYVGRYCYENLSDAKEALKEWDGKDDPSGPWIKYKGEGGERINENYEK